MENFKFTLLSIIILIMIIFIGYWAFFTMESGSVHVDKQKEQQLEEENVILQEEVERLTSELEKYTGIEETPVVEETEENTETNIPTILKHQTLINELQKLVEDNIIMREKSRGTRVGTVQTFLNLYNNTSRKIDNDYGATTKADMIKFQKGEGLTASGEASSVSFNKMIEWLKK